MRNSSDESTAREPPLVRKEFNLMRASKVFSWI